jgi:hypothetical protein
MPGTETDRPSVPVVGEDMERHLQFAAEGGLVVR